MASLVELCFLLVITICATPTRTVAQLGGICLILGNFDSELPALRDINIGDNVTLHCKEKYFEGTTWSKCNQHGQMSTPKPPCQLVECPTPEALPHGKIKGNGTITQVGRRYDVIHYICEDGYWYTGTPTRTCQRNGEWSGSKGPCKEVQCSSPRALKHGKYKEVPPFKYNSILTAECDEGYVYNGTDKRRCQGDNQWSGQEGTCISMQAIQCSLTLQKNRFTVGYNQVVDFTCEKGFTYSGTHRRTCQVNSTWSGTDGTCNRIFCSKPQVSIENGWIVGCDKSTDKCEYESTVKVVCDKGHEHNGSELVCNEDGNWNGTIGHCQEILCTAPEKVANGHINISGSSYKSTGEVTCNTGYTIIGKHEVHCQYDGTWSSPGSCREPSKHVQTGGIIWGLIVALFVVLAIILFFVRRRIRRLKQEKIDLELGNQIKARGHIVDRRYDQRIDLDTEYIKLHLIDENDKDAEKVASDHTMPYLGRGEGKEVDLEELIQNSRAGSKIMLVGRAGVGKSTLVQKTIRRWAQGEWGENYKYVFLLSVRHLAVIENREMTLRDLLVKYNVYARDKQTYDDFEVNNENQPMLLFIDGLDEFPDLRGKLKDFKVDTVDYDDVGKPYSLVVQVLKRTFLSSSTLILTSRPFRGLPQLKPYQGVKVFGLTRSTLMEFIERNVKDVSHEKREEIKAEFTKNPILQSVSSITFFCMMLCQAFKKKLDHNGTAKELKTYTRLTTFIMQRYMARAPLEEECDQQQTPLLSAQDIRDFTPFSKLAFLGLVERRNNSDIARLVFDENDLCSAGIADEHRKEGESSGFLLCTEYTGENGEEKILVEFAHLSIQELLAMVHLLNQPDNTLTESFSKMWTTGRFNMAQLYLFGLQFDTSNDHNRAFMKLCLSNVQPAYEAQMKSILMNHLKMDEKIGRYEKMRAVQIAYESQCTDLACEIGKTLFTKTGEVSFRDMTLSAVDMNAIVFVIQQTNEGNHHARTGNITKLKLVRMSIDDACLGILSTFIITVGIITDLSLDGNSLSYDGLKVLTDAVKKCSTLRSISLQSTDISDDSINLVAHMLEANTSLEEASLMYNRFDDKGTQCLASALRARKEPLHVKLEKDRKKRDILEKELSDINHIQIR